MNRETGRERKEFGIVTKKMTVLGDALLIKLEISSRAFLTTCTNQASYCCAQRVRSMVQKNELTFEAATAAAAALLSLIFFPPAFLDIATKGSKSGETQANEQKFRDVSLPCVPESSRFFVEIKNSKFRDNWPNL